MCNDRTRIASAVFAVLTLFCCLTNECLASEIGRLRHIDYNGTDYVEKTSMTALLLLGIDQTKEQENDGNREGGQADFIMLLMIDHNAKVIRQLQIDRDTVMEVPTANVFGQRNGTRTTQICLAHAFGGGSENGCAFMLEALEGFLDFDIPLYLSINLNAIGTINDVLGGVTVVLPEDYSELDPVMVKGAELTLNAEQAEYLVRSRRSVGDGTNASRMIRQRTYLSAAGEQFKAMVKQDSGFFDRLLDLLEEDMVTNVSRGRLINEMNRAIYYDILPVETLTGEYTLGDDGFVEFHADTECVRRWVFDTCFIPNTPY